MANPNSPNGFTVYKSEGKEYRVRYYIKKTGNAINDGDAVILTATGNVDIAAATGQLLGIAAGAALAASVDQIAVYDDPELELVAQATTFALADIGQNCNWAVGTPVGYVSGGYLDATTKDVTSTLQFKLLGLHESGDNAVGAYARVRCKINNHVFSAGTTGI